MCVKPGLTPSYQGIEGNIRFVPVSFQIFIATQGDMFFYGHTLQAYNQVSQTSFFFPYTTCSDSFSFYVTFDKALTEAQSRFHNLQIHHGTHFKKQGHKTRVIYLHEI